MEKLFETLDWKLASEKELESQEQQFLWWGDMMSELQGMKKFAFVEGIDVIDDLNFLWHIALIRKYMTDEVIPDTEGVEMGRYMVIHGSDYDEPSTGWCVYDQDEDKDIMQFDTKESAVEYILRIG